MKPAAVIIMTEAFHPQYNDLISSFNSNPFIEKIITITNHNSATAASNDVLSIQTDLPSGGRSLAEAIELVKPCPYALFIHPTCDIAVSSDQIKRFLEVAEKKEGGLYYADYYSGTNTPAGIRPLTDYQDGSIRDDFFFGPLLLFCLEHVYKSLKKYGRLTDTKWAGLYELRLKVSLLGDIVRIPEPLSLVADKAYGKTSLFNYVDPKHLEYQNEMEKTATEHLKRIGAFCSHEFKALPSDLKKSYPVEASVVIPVRNREKTIADAIASALSQKTDGPFNVLVVQNHSTDKTGEQIAKIAQDDSRVVQIIPARTDLGIGGCWNEAVTSSQCGHYVCQLDSDDLYAANDALSRMLQKLSSGKYGMVVGSYRIVDFDLDEIPPGVVDHREWSEENGRNNLLRVHGIGAPRAFPTVMLRKYPFPNVSYGEDYSVALRISRDYRVGRIYSPLYLCRRWEENTDANLPPAEENRLAFFKDGLRTREIMERRRLYALSE